MQELLRSLLTIQEAVLRGVRRHGGELEPRELRWIVDAGLPGGRERIRLQVRRNGRRVFENTFTREEIDSWLVNPRCVERIRTAIGLIAALRRRGGQPFPTGGSAA